MVVGSIGRAVRGANKAHKILLQMTLYLFAAGLLALMSSYGVFMLTGKNTPVALGSGGVVFLWFSWMLVGEMFYG